jgi:hypothetical protein
MRGEERLVRWRVACSPRGAKRNAGRCCGTMLRDGLIPDFAALHPGYDCGSAMEQGE